MKYLLPLFLLGMPFALKAQFVVGGLGITLKGGAVVTIDQLVLQPTADLSIQNNQLQRSTSAVPLSNSNSVERVYLFTTPVAYSGTIGFIYNDTELAGNTESSLNLFYSSGTSGNLWAISPGTIINTVSNNISAPISMVSIARITAGSAQPLPVTLIQFIARKDASEQSALLDWTVASEYDLKSYTIERSSDGKVFAPIGDVPAMGITTYQLIDDNPLTGQNFYRLKMNDLTGSYSYSQVRILSFLKNSVVFEVYPNPIKNQNLTIAVHEKVSKKRSAVIMDINGRVIYTFMLEGVETQLNVSKWEAGAYFIKINDEAVFKFIKQ